MDYSANIKIKKANGEYDTINMGANYSITNNTISVPDTGWINLTSSYGTWDYLRYRVVNSNHVYIEGYANSLTPPASGSRIVTTNLPSDLLPLSVFHFYGTLSAGRIGRWFVGSNGIGIDWAITISSGDRYTTATWHEFHFDYFV